MVGVGDSVIESGTKLSEKQYIIFETFFYPQCQLKLIFLVLSYVGGSKDNIKQATEVNNNSNIHYSN